jgi:hypothetical protein
MHLLELISRGIVFFSRSKLVSAGLSAATIQKIQKTKQDMRAWFRS